MLRSCREDVIIGWHSLLSVPFALGLRGPFYDSWEFHAFNDHYVCYSNGITLMIFFPPYLLVTSDPQFPPFYSYWRSQYRDFLTLLSATNNQFMGSPLKDQTEIITREYHQRHKQAVVKHPTIRAFKLHKATRLRRAEEGASPSSI